MVQYIPLDAVVAEIEKKKERVISQTPFAKGVRYGFEEAIDAWGYFSKGLPSDCRYVVKQYFDKAMNEKLKELSQG